MSEPWALLQLWGHHLKGRFNERQVESLTRACVILQCKRELKKDTSRFVVKLPTLVSPLGPILRKCFPSAKMVFVTRRPKASIESFMKILQGAPTCFRALKLDKKFWYDHFPLDKNASEEAREFLRRKWRGEYSATSKFEGVCRAYAASLSCYRLHKDVYDAGLIVYEEFVEDVKVKTEALFDKLCISREHVADAIGALQKHSQVMSVHGSKFTLK